jgi:murein DD-endopeptidase MepM/ murein hydrolase activator NlpD
LVSCSIFAQSKKERLIEDILTTSKNFNNIHKIIPILKKYPASIKYVPLGNPIEQKDSPVITSFFGNRFHPKDKVYKFHSGIDLNSEYATIIRTTADGIVTFAGKKGGYGKCVIIEHKYGYSTLYGHLTIYYTKKDKIVKKGDAIGFLGSTGKSTGNHLHYEIIKNKVKINPLDFYKYNE